MSKTNKDLAKEAKEDLKRSAKEARKASDKFKVIGDPDGKMLADDAADAADKGVGYVDERLE